MKENAKFKRAGRVRRKLRVRRKIHGTAERPRLAVYRSNRNIFAQVIDDDAGATLVAANSMKVESPSIEGVTGKVAAAKAVGIALAKLAQEKGISRVVFDRAGYKYHGRVAALADGAREGGLQL